MGQIAMLIIHHQRAARLNIPSNFGRLVAAQLCERKTQHQAEAPANAVWEPEKASRAVRVQMRTMRLLSDLETFQVRESHAVTLRRRA